VACLLIFSRDPGATNQLIAIVEVLASAGPRKELPGLAVLRAATDCLIGDLKIMARPPANGLWVAAGFSPASWEGDDEEAATALLVNSGTGLLLTGTSDIDEHGDRMLWRAARRLGIESHAVLDHPANLRARFIGPNGCTVLPDWIYVEDAVMAKRLEEVEVSKSRIRVTGELHHTRLRRLAAGRTAEVIKALRTEWGADPETTAILFASECTREMAMMGRPSPYDEVAILRQLLQTIAAGKHPASGHLDSASTLVIIRPHPRDSERKYDGIDFPRLGSVRVVVSNKEPADLALMAADVVVGMNCSLMYEAIALGRPTISMTGHDLSSGKSRAG
jgi:hypothetical protein